MRPGAFSVSVDERDKGSPWENALEMLLNRQAKPLSFMIRDHLADPTATFAKAVTAYQHTPLIAPVYIIVGGVAAGEGAIITRDRLFALDVWRIALPDNWWRLETNYVLFDGVEREGVYIYNIIIYVCVCMCHSFCSFPPPL